MGTAIGRIEKEFVLKNLGDKKMPITIHGVKEEIHGLIQSCSDDELTILLDKPSESPYGAEVRVFFSYFGHVMTFETRILGKDEKSLTLKMPPGIYKNLQRKYERVPCPRELTVSFTIQDTKIELDYPKTEEYNPVDPPEYSLTFDPTSIDQLVQDFKSEAKAYASENQIVMFRGRMPETFEEKLITTTGKTLFIPTTQGGIPIDEPSDRYPIITVAFLRSNENKEEREEILTGLENIIIRRRNEGVHRIRYCPRIYHEYVAGYVGLINRGGNNAPIEPGAVDYVCQFASVLVYSLKMNGYFKGGKPALTTIAPEILDISASGLLFASPEKRLKDVITLYTDLALTISIGPRNMKVSARVMRKLSDRSNSYFGLVFLDIKPEDFRCLYDSIYGKPFDPELHEKWEGGAEPPKLDLG